MVSDVGLFMVSVVAGQLFAVWLPSLVVLWFPSWQETTVYGFRRWICDGFCRRRRIHNSIMYRVIPRFELLRLVSVAGSLFYGFRRGEETFVLWFASFAVVVVFHGFRRGRENVVMVSIVVFYMVSGCYGTAAVSPMDVFKTN